MDVSPSRCDSYRGNGSPERRARFRSPSDAHSRRTSRSRSRTRHRSRSSEESSPPRRRYRSRSSSSSPERSRRSRKRSRGRECWECKVCRAAFRSNPALQDHIRAGGCRYSRPAEEVQLHKCYYCREEFTSRRSLLIHIKDKQHQLPQSTITAIQGDVIKSSSSNALSETVDKLVLMEKPAEEFLQCQICPKRFFDKTGLYQHMASLNHFTAAEREKGVDKMLENAGPSKSGTYACTICRKTFLDKRALQYHMGSTGHFSPADAPGGSQPATGKPTTPPATSTVAPSTSLSQVAPPPPPAIQTRPGGRFVPIEAGLTSQNGDNDPANLSNTIRSPTVGGPLPFPFPTDPPQGRQSVARSEDYRSSRFTSPPASPGANEQYLYNLMRASPEPPSTSPAEVDRMWNIRAISLLETNRSVPSSAYYNNTQSGYPPPARDGYYDRNAYEAAAYRSQPRIVRPVEKLSEQAVIIPQNYVPGANANTPYMGAPPQYGTYQDAYDNRTSAPPDPYRPHDPRRSTQIQTSATVDARTGDNSPHSSERTTPVSAVAAVGPPITPLDDIMAPRMITGSFTRTSAVQQRLPSTALPVPRVPSAPVLRPPVPPPVRVQPEVGNFYDDRSRIPPAALRASPDVPVINAHPSRFANTQPVSKPVTPFRVEAPVVDLVPPVPVELRIPYARDTPPIPIEDLPRFSPEVEPPPVEDERIVTPETPTQEEEDLFTPQRLPVEDVERYSPDIILGEVSDTEETPVVSKREMLLSSVPELCLDCSNPLNPTLGLSYNVMNRRWHVCCLECGWETVASA